MQKYTSDLITNESGLSIMMEKAIKQIAEENERIKAAGSDTKTDEEEAAIMNYDNDIIITDDDFSEFKDFEIGLAEED